MGILSVPYEKDTVGIRTPLINGGYATMFCGFFVSI